jgi:hypothetical protein
MIRTPACFPLYVGMFVVVVIAITFSVLGCFPHHPGQAPAATATATPNAALPRWGLGLPSWGHGRLPSGLGVPRPAHPPRALLRTCAQLGHVLVLVLRLEGPLPATRRSPRPCPTTLCLLDSPNRGGSSRRTPERDRLRPPPGPGRLVRVARISTCVSIPPRRSSAPAGHTLARLTESGATLDRIIRSPKPSGYLVGDCCTVADLTAAALFSPLARPASSLCTPRKCRRSTSCRRRTTASGTAPVDISGRRSSRSRRGMRAEG